MNNTKLTIYEKKWDDNELQFARLIHEIDSTQFVDWDQIAGQMDLETSEVGELISRANGVFTGVKLYGYLTQ